MSLEENNEGLDIVSEENDRWGELSEILLNTQEQCQMVKQLIDNQIEVKDAQINKLYAELEYYKKDTADRYVEQVMKSIIKVRKDIIRKMESDDWLELSAEQLRKEYTYIFEDLTDLLEQQNIDSIKTVSGERFDASMHQAKVEVTDNPELDKLIKCSLNEGYIKGSKVIIPERVIVYQYKENGGEK